MVRFDVDATCTFAKSPLVQYLITADFRRRADANGLVAVGGDLSVERLLAAYRSGIFPWTVKPVSWWSPDPRGIFELEQFHVSKKSLAQNDPQAKHFRSRWTRPSLK